MNGAFRSARRLPRTHFSDQVDPWRTGTPVICGADKQRDIQPGYATGVAYRVDCGRCLRILDQRASKEA